MAKPEVAPRLLRRFRRVIQGYHTEVEELGRVLQALESAGLTTYSVKKVERTHYLLERHLEELDAGTFGTRHIAKLVAQFEGGVLPSYSPDDAFESAKGRAIVQMQSVEKRWAQLHELAFEADVDVPNLELESEAAALEREVSEEN